ncbi:hypothetical protein ALC57_03286 [Trachymyrmex cornetzi]|uniref:Uncharacterized protein n=1 Tax=Trachymyrmex cornetzi TaxID=471704 RepID=A0A195EF91_9HYME|nr:hypothetical protein ALC57_03286 [Trachymyrmex cornetzi]
MGRSENETETETYNKVSRRVRRVELCCVVWWRVSSEVFVGTVRSGVDERVQEKEETGGQGGRERAQVKKEERHCSDGDGDGGDGADGGSETETEIAIKYITGEK